MSEFRLFSCVTYVNMQTKMFVILQQIYKYILNVCIWVVSICNNSSFIKNPVSQKLIQTKPTPSTRSIINNTMLLISLFKVDKGQTLPQGRSSASILKFNRSHTQI